MLKRRPFSGGGSLGSGLVTAGSMAVMTAAAAVLGALLARRFGRSGETDGFFVAYGGYTVLLLAATAFRVVVLPRFVRARDAGALGAELVGYASGLALVAVPALVLTVLAPDWLAGQLTATEEARRAAADAFVWLGPAAAAQLLAGVAASALAALDDYAVAAAGFAVGALAGLALILLTVDELGLLSLSYGIALNGAISLAVPVAELARRRELRRLRAVPLRLGRRVGEFLRGVSLPLALQALYVVALRSAGEFGVGSQTSLSYAFLIASSLVAVTASSLALVSSVPLTRAGAVEERVGPHVVSTTWLALTGVAAAAGVFAVAGEPLVRLGLGEAYAGDVGAELGLLVVYLAPWMVASVAVSVAFPLLFVAGRERVLLPIAGAALAAHVAIDWAGRTLLGLPGIAAALAVTTTLVLAVVLATLSRRALFLIAGRILRPALVLGALAAVCFALAAAVLDPLPAVVLGAAAYLSALLLLRPRGLLDALEYARLLR